MRPSSRLWAAHHQGAPVRGTGVKAVFRADSALFKDGPHAARVKVSLAV